MWVTRRSYVGHIRIALWVSESSGSASVTHFQPWNVASVTGANYCPDYYPSYIYMVERT